MTAKQALREWVETMSEEAAEELLARLEWESIEFDDPPSPEELVLLKDAMAAIANGDVLPADAVFKDLGL
jgi:hypothetical protein